MPEAHPVETAIVEWVRSADLYRDGELVRSGLNLLGSNEIAAKAWAKTIVARLDSPVDRESLAAFLLTKEASQHVRMYSQAQPIAEGLLHMLETKGLLP